MQKIRNIILCVAITEIFLYFSEIIRQEIFLEWKIGLVVKIALFIILLIIVWLKSYKPLNIFLIVFSLISVFTGTINAAEDFFEESSDLKTYKYTLRKTPNIYLYVLESYHDFSTIRQAYNIDTSNLEIFLNENDFVIYEDALSNSRVTLKSLADLFSMRLDFGKEKGNDDTDRSIRYLIGGNYRNMVLKNLKENGYYTEYILRGATYYILEKGAYLDAEDANLFGLRLLQPLVDVNKSFRKLLPRPTTRTNMALDQVIPRFVDEKADIKAPLFVFFFGGARHTPAGKGRGRHLWRDSEKWVASGQYQQAVEKSNRELMRVVQHIIKRDPESVIILLGDHGSHRLRDLQSPTLTELDNTLNSIGETLESYVKDHCGILMAVRMLDGRKDISYGLHMSPVNLFRHIFAALNESPDFLKDRVPSESKIYGRTLARDGKVLRE